jgi:hypothetical protein
MHENIHILGRYLNKLAPIAYAASLIAGTYLFYDSSKDNKEVNAWKQYRSEHKITELRSELRSIKQKEKSIAKTPGDYFSLLERKTEITSRLDAVENTEEYRDLEKRTDDELEHVQGKSTLGVMLMTIGAGGLLTSYWPNNRL